MEIAIEISLGFGKEKYGRMFSGYLDRHDELPLTGHALYSKCLMLLAKASTLCVARLPRL